MTIVPNFKDPDVTKFLVELVRDVERAKKSVLSSASGNHSVLLLSPSLKTYEITVTDAGALVVTKVQG